MYVCGFTLYIHTCFLHEKEGGREGQREGERESERERERGRES